MINNEMLTGKPFKLLMKFALPMALGYVFQQLYSLVDSVIVGRYLGVNALAAVGSTTSLLMLLCSLIIGTTIGAGVVVGQYYGSGDEKSVAQAITNATYFNVFISIIVLVISVIFARPLLGLLRTPAIIIDDAVTYLTIYMLGIVSMTLFYMSFSILRAFGDSKTPLYFMIVSSILNIGLDIVLITVFHMGVAGAALATIIAQSIAAIACIIYSFKTNKFFNAALHNREIHIPIIKQTAKIGLTMGVQNSLIFLSTSLLQMIINGYGETTIAAYTATSRIEVLMQQPLMAWSNAMTVYTSQNIGAGQPERIHDAMKVSYRVIVVYAIGIITAFSLFGRQLISVFTTDTAVMELGRNGIIITGSFVFMLGLVQVLRNVLNGSGDTTFSLMNGIVEIVARVSLCIVLTNISFIGVWGIWLTTGLTWSASALFALWRYKSGAWKTKSLINHTNKSSA